MIESYIKYALSTGTWVKKIFKIVKKVQHRYYIDLTILVQFLI